jgi:periplasmic divalent cation tolerance protein
MSKGAAVAWVGTHVANETQARVLVEAVVGARLAACANMWPIQSVYWWEGKVERGAEVAVHLKTTPARLAALVAHVRSSHPYEVPYIEWGRGADVDGRYAKWLKAETSARRQGTRRRT